MSKPTINVPRLNANRGFLGPEFAGCIGTGRRPYLLHCGYSERYIVGPESSVAALRSKIMASPGKRIFRDGTTIVYAFKSRKPAVAKFIEQCEGVFKFNQDTREAHKRADEAIKRGDTVTAALIMLDQ